MTVNNSLKIKNKLKGLAPAVQMEEDASMDRFTSFRAGGRADLLITVEDEDGLCSVLEALSEEGYPHMILGRGSNVLVRDGGYRGAMVRLGEGFQRIDRRGSQLICGGAVLLSAVARRACDEGLSGFEFASGIPGSTGGAVFMNAGAYGGEMKDVLTKVRLVASDGSRIREADPEELDLGYRTSRIQATGEVVSSAVVRLSEGDPEKIRARMSELMEKRNARQPVNLPSAGSFFKRPEGYFAGKLIEDAGLGGLTVGGAQVSELHKGFIVNTGAATASDIIQLMNIVQATVMDRSGVMLEPEVRIVGEE